VFASPEIAVHLEARAQSGSLGDVSALGPDHAPVVAAEYHQRSPRHPGPVQRVEQPPNAAIELVNPIAERASGAPAGQVVVGRDRIVNGHGSEIQEERTRRGLAADPVHRPFGQDRHHPPIFPPGRVEIEDLAGAGAVLEVLFAVVQLEVRAVRGRMADGGPRGDAV